MTTKKFPSTQNEDEVLRRMLHTPPTHHKAKPAPAKKTEKKPQPKRPTPRKAWE